MYGPYGTVHTWLKNYVLDEDRVEFMQITENRVEITESVQSLLKIILGF